MLITFDIDETIRLHGSSQPPEQPVITWAARLFYREPIRIGFIKVCNDLRSQGCRIGIYTTSSRSVGYIRRWMGCYGFRPDLIVNATIHEEALSGLFERGRPPSKHPGLFGVDLHIDDSKGIAIEAELFGFRALIIDPENLNWGASILDSVRALAINQRSRHYDEYERKRQSEQPRFYGGGEVIHREPLRKQSIGFVATHERLKLSL